MEDNVQISQIKYSEDQRLHLQMIQDIISRMASNSFMMKGWMLTIVAAFLALYVGNGNPLLLIAPVLPVIVFWILDSTYLQLERKFRGLYGDVIKGEVTSYSMDISSYVKPNAEERDDNKRKKQRETYGFWNVFFSKTIWPLYLTIIVILVGIFAADQVGWLNILQP